MPALDILAAEAFAAVFPHILGIQTPLEGVIGGPPSARIRVHTV